MYLDKVRRNLCKSLPVIHNQSKSQYVISVKGRVAGYRLFTGAKNAPGTLSLKSHY